MIVIIFISTLALVRGASWTEPVNTTQGLVRGLFAEDGDYSMYLGIPYAKVNEDNPFGASSPHPSFDGVYDAIDDTVICPQEEEFSNTIGGTFDCLQLNVYVPNSITVESTVPVLVYFYGGMFTIGSHGRFLYGPKFLVRHDIIFVVFNYRLGPYGFLCLDTEEVPGNQGIRDQYLALKWIKENIEAFGGNPDMVTIMGESAGAMSIDFYLMSEYPILYDQVILQSGAGLVPDVILPSDNTIPLRLAEHLGFTTNDLQEAISFLAQTHTDLVMAATFELQRSVVKYLNSGAQVYQYLFSYDGGRNFIKTTRNITAAGAAHADELGYLFDMSIFTEIPAPEDQLMIDRITTMWANFVKYGNPTPSTSELLPVTWTPATKEVIWYLDIDSNLRMGTRPLHARMSFWELFYSANRDNLFANVLYDPSASSSYRFLPSVTQILLFVPAIYILHL